MTTAIVTITFFQAHLSVAIDKAFYTPNLHNLMVPTCSKTNEMKQLAGIYSVVETTGNFGWFQIENSPKKQNWRGKKKKAKLQ